MEAVLWLLLPVFTATGSALLAFLVMQARLEVAVAKEREALAEAQAAIRSQDRVMEEKLRALEEETRRRSLDEFLADIRVEERHYVKESRSLFLNQKSMVLQERLYFRNIPLSDWVSHEFTIEEGGDVRVLAKACSVFARASVGKQGGNAAKLLES
jgi:hypothetical protein